MWQPAATCTLRARGSLLCSPGPTCGLWGSSRRLAISALLTEGACGPPAPLLVCRRRRLSGCSSWPGPRLRRPSSRWAAIPLMSHAGTLQACMRRVPARRPPKSEMLTCRSGPVGPVPQLPSRSFLAHWRRTVCLPPGRACWTHAPTPSWRQTSRPRSCTISRHAILLVRKLCHQVTFVEAPCLVLLPGRGSSATSGRDDWPNTRLAFRGPKLTIRAVPGTQSSILIRLGREPKTAGQRSEAGQLLGGLLCAAQP